MTLSLIDILLLAVVVASLANGWRRGFILGVLDLLGWALVVLTGLRFYQSVAKWLEANIDLWSEVWDRPVAFLLVATLVFAGVQLIGSALLQRIPQEVHERRVNQAFGLLPGLANGLITAALVSALLLSMPLSQSLHARARDSAMVNRLAVYAERLEAVLHPVFGEAVAHTLNLLTVQPESDERVSLPYKVENTRPRSELEARMLELVNRERAAAGVRPLAPDLELTQVARRHSADMFARGYFAHETPDGRDPFERMREAEVRFLAAGENLALAPTVMIAHTGLMNSPGHRRNILDPKFGRVGIGIMDGGMRGLMVTQNFRN